MTQVYKAEEQVCFIIYCEVVNNVLNSTASNFAIISLAFKITNSCKFRISRRNSLLYLMAINYFL